MANLWQRDDDGKLLDFRPEQELRSQLVNLQGILMAQLCRKLASREVPDAWYVGDGKLADMINHADLGFSRRYKEHLHAVNKVCNWAKHRLWQPSHEVDQPELVYCECIRSHPRDVADSTRPRICQRIAKACGSSLYEQAVWRCPTLYLN